MLALLWKRQRSLVQLWLHTSMHTLQISDRAPLTKMLHNHRCEHLWKSKSLCLVNKSAGLGALTEISLKKILSDITHLRENEKGEESSTQYVNHHKQALSFPTCFSYRWKQMQHRPANVLSDRSRAIKLQQHVGSQQILGTGHFKLRHAWAQTHPMYIADTCMY